MSVFQIFNLTGRTALLTGASKGLGLAMARGFAEAGAALVICSRHEDELKRAAEVIRNGSGAGCRVEYIVADLSDRLQASAMADEAITRMGSIDILVNNAGSNVPQPIDQIVDADWDRIVELNLSSVMAVTRAVVPGMKERRWGRIIHISSLLGLGSREARNAYSATKAGLIGLAQSSALDLGSFNITVNCIAPGPFLTDLPLTLFTEEQRKEFSNRTALGRWGDPGEIVGPALLLASEAGSYITGSTLLVDGGARARAL